MLFVLGGMMLAGLTACSGDDDTATNDNAPQTADDGVKMRRLTITEADDGAAEARQALTRASLAEGDGILNASWTVGDGLTYCNLSRVDYGNSDAPYSGSLTAASTAATSQFTGNVTCSKGDDYLAVVYPATTFETNESYTISLAGQDGTLATLATNFHYVYGRAHVTSVTETTANATMEKMKSLLTVCKFSFVNKDGGAVIPIKTLTISYGGNPEIDSWAGKYPQAATVAIGANTEQADVHAEGVEGDGALTVTCPSVQDAVYVALLPTAAARTFSFSVSGGSGSTYTGTAKGSGSTYTGTAKATLAEGEYVEATGLKLTKQQ